MHVAGYGPRALGVAGRVGDGVIIQLADPQIIQWIMDTARKAAEEEGRDPDALECIVCAPSHVTGRPRRGARPGALVPGDGLEPRHGPDRALRRRLRRDPGGADRLRQGAQVLRLQGAQPRRRQARRVRDRRDLRPLLRARHARAGGREAEGARVDRRRPVQRLPDDRGPGAIETRGHLREGDHPPGFAGGQPPRRRRKELAAEREQQRAA